MVSPHDGYRYHFSTPTILRYVLYPQVWRMMLRQPTQSLFLGAAPMGFATIITMIIYLIVPVWGDWVKILAWALWRVDVILAILTCYGIPILACVVIVVIYSLSDWIRITVYDVSLDGLTALTLLPVVATIVAASTDSIVANVLEPAHAHLTLTISFILWGAGVPLACVLIAIYYQRLILYHLLPNEVIVSAFLPLGPLG